MTRLRLAHAATNERKLDHDAEYHEHLLRELSDCPPLEHLVTRMERNPRRFALSVSNVPGPREPVSVLDTPVAHLHSLAEIGGIVRSCSRGSTRTARSSTRRQPVHTRSTAQS